MKTDMLTGEGLRNGRTLTEGLVGGAAKAAVAVLDGAAPAGPSMGRQRMLTPIVNSWRAADLLLSGPIAAPAEVTRIGVVRAPAPNARMLDKAVNYENDRSTRRPSHVMTVHAFQFASSGTGVPLFDSPGTVATLMLTVLHRLDVLEGVAHYRDKRLPRFSTLSVRSSHVPV
ncbi:hypothetical protein [Rhodococcus koreensis]|uniref:hypothetical protein n=1 Tax=Rhodococcus koreensis TaxID=99653 RepID=UPI00366BE53B